MKDKYYVIDVDSEDIRDFDTKEAAEKHLSELIENEGIDDYQDFKYSGIKVIRGRNLSITLPTKNVTIVE